MASIAIEVLIEEAETVFIAAVETVVEDVVAASVETAVEGAVVAPVAEGAADAGIAALNQTEAEVATDVIDYTEESLMAAGRRFTLEILTSPEVTQAVCQKLFLLLIGGT